MWLGAEYTEAYRDLTTWACWSFNLRNVPLLPKPVEYSAIAADADRNCSKNIDVLFEIEALRHEEWKVQQLINNCPQWAIKLCNASYQTTRNFVRVSVTRGPCPGDPQKQCATIAGVPPAPRTPILNDILVSVRSGLGSAEGSFSSVVTQRQEPYTGWLGRNHADVANADMAERVAPTLLVAERTRGDLR
jgi:hypothetical protein